MILRCLLLSPVRSLTKYPSALRFNFSYWKVIIKSEACCIQMLMKISFNQKLYLSNFKTSKFNQKTYFEKIIFKSSNFNNTYEKALVFDFYFS